MRLLVILTVVSAVIAIPLPARPKKKTPWDRSRGQPRKPYETWWENKLGNNPIDQTTLPTESDAESGETEPTSGDATPNAEIPNAETPNTENPNAFQNIDPAQLTGDVLNGAWDINAKVLDTIEKYTPLGGASKAAGVGAAAVLDFFTGGGGGVPTLPDIPNAGAFGGGGG